MKPISSTIRSNIKLRVKKKKYSGEICTTALSFALKGTSEKCLIQR